MHEKGKDLADFATYTIGLLAVMIGAIACYILALLGVITELDATLVMIVLSIVGFIMVIVGVMLRAHRSGRDVTGPLIFGIGLLVAMGGSLVVYTLALYQMVSETGATLALASIMILSIVLVVAGIVYRACCAESKKVVMPPLRKVYTRRVDPDNQ